MNEMVRNAKLESILEWAKRNEHVGAILGYGSYFSGQENPKDIDILVILENKCPSCSMKDACSTDEEVSNEFQVNIHSECITGYYELLEFARNRNENELPLDIKILNSSKLFADVDVVTTITKEGWNHWTFCGDNFFYGNKCLYVSKAHEKYMR